ncbi:MAG: HAD hydrolase-like protein [Clostridia bacterium]|nr:HAD hydrolase-like protein [Clostridia bacterium]
MAKLAKFLDKYDSVIFDMDGVVTSENNYWTASALTVWEYLFPDSSVKEIADNAKQIRKTVMCNDKLISLLKGKGVNSNWDLSYIIYAVCKIYDTTDFNTVMDICSSFSDNILDEYAIIGDKLTDVTGIDGTRNGKLWTDMMMCFQEWFLGDDLYFLTYKQPTKNPGKKGLIEDETPIVDNDCLKEIFNNLKNSGKRIATATGRPSAEITKPLKDFGIYDCFDADGLINYDYVQFAEEALGKTLSKPHPYIFIKAMMGKDYPDNDIINDKYDKDNIRRTLIVGDAGADILAAKAIGVDFCAVLTGVSGKAAKSYFEELNSEYIFDSLEDFIA